MLVISDLHLGGAPAKDGAPGFQMCSPAGQERLAAFVRWARAQRTSEQEVLLVLAGDVVDFLAEAPFAPLTLDDGEAGAKLKQIFDHSSEVWTALRDYLAAGASLTVLLGNHDPELSLPGPRRLLLARLGPGRLEFIDDNRALILGPVLIEHGNRYDSWNRISHDELRQVRSALSRRESPPRCIAAPGSVLVTELINQIKPQFPFIDLLKPENEAVLPLLAVIDPKTISKLGSLRTTLREHRRRGKSRIDGQPLRPGEIAAVGDGITPAEEAIFELAGDLAGAPRPGEIGAGDSLEALGHYLAARDIADARNREEAIRRLHRALKERAAVLYATFDVTAEKSDYLDQARRYAGRGLRYVIMGHTHLVKRVPLAPNGLYLNTGTWADVISLPEGTLYGEEGSALLGLDRFASDLADGRTDVWRRLVPSFVRIEMHGDEVLGVPDVLLFQEGGRIVPAPRTSLRELWA